MLELLRTRHLSGKRLIDATAASTEERDGMRESVFSCNCEVNDCVVFKWFCLTFVLYASDYSLVGF